MYNEILLALFNLDTEGFVTLQFQSVQLYLNITRGKT